ncbi:MAG: hypothetical protein Q9201_007575 [Fulgogasparrea decipioides]
MSGFAAVNISPWKHQAITTHSASVSNVLTNRVDTGKMIQSIDMSSPYKKKQKHKAKDNATNSNRSRSESTAPLTKITTPQKQSSGSSRTPSSEKRYRDNDNYQGDASSWSPPPGKRLKRMHSVKESTNVFETRTEVLSSSPVRDSERSYTPSTNSSLDSQHASPSGQRSCPRHQNTKEVGSQRKSSSPATISSLGMTIAESSSSSTARFARELTVTLERSMQDVSASDDLLPGNSDAFREAEAKNPKHTMRVLAQLESLVKEQAELVAASQRKSRMCRLILQKVLGGALPRKTIAFLGQDFLSAFEANKIRKRQPTGSPELEGQLAGKPTSREIGKDQAASKTTTALGSNTRKENNDGAKEATNPIQMNNQPQSREGCGSEAAQAGREDSPTPRKRKSKGQKRRERKKLRTGEQETPSDPGNAHRKPETTDPSTNDGAGGVREASHEESEIPDIDTLLHRNRAQHNPPCDQAVNAGSQSQQTTNNPVSVTAHAIKHGAALKIPSRTSSFFHPTTKGQRLISATEAPSLSIQGNPPEAATETSNCLQQRGKSIGPALHTVLTSGRPTTEI